MINLGISLKQVEPPYHFIEVMGCPGGCINGGGQPRPSNRKIREDGVPQKISFFGRGADVPLVVNDRPDLAALVSRPTVNIEGLVAGWTGPGGMTVLPHRAVAKLDLRLVPDMTFDGAVAALRAHLAKRGFGDVEVRPSGGYDPTQTPADAPLIQRQLAVYRDLGLEPTLWPRNAGSYPGYVFTGPPLRLASGHFGVGHGGDLHAPDEYLVIEPSSPKVKGYDDAVRAFVDYLYALAR